MRKIIYSLFFAATIFVSCNKSNMSTAIVESIEASVDTVMSLDLCVYPIHIERVGNYLVVLDAGNKNQCLSAYSLDGTLIQQFGDFGKAANEVNEVFHFFKVDDHTISVCKPGGILYFQLDSLEEFRYKYEYKQMGFPMGIHDVYADSLGILRFSFSNNERFAYIDRDGDCFIYNSYPTGCVENPDDEMSVFNYKPGIGMDMLNKRFCVGTYIGGVLETFNITAEGIKPNGVNMMFNSEYTKFDNGAVSWNKDSRIGFDAICAGTDHIYALLSGAKGDCLINGEKESFSDKITVFNWDATIDSEIYVGHNMLAVSVSEDRKELYAICYNPGESFYMVHASW